MANPALLRSVGRTSGEMLGRSVRHVVEPAGVREVTGAFREVARSGQPMTGVELRYRRADGSRQRGDMSVSLVRDRAGAPIGFRGVVRNVEERMRQQ